MEVQTYEKLAVIMRYPLALAGVFIALRALYMAFKDGVRASRLRSGEAKYGAVAMLSVLPAERRGKAQRIPILRNGCVGSSGASDVRIKGMGLAGRQFDYEIRSGLMHISLIRSAGVSLVGKRANEEITSTIALAPGEKLMAGRAVIGFEMLKTPRGANSPAGNKVYRLKGKRQ